ncbi:hypothetical protein ACFVX9_30525 [Kitasatospora sp. NPDC058243]|uniref:hypothetical protein n=1 Tax=Kitasatospora sp. NPDC058243 TaxID=3346397 RepID=UPI0036D7CC1A
MTPPPLDLDAIQARLAAATPGPWRREHCGPLGEDTLIGRTGAIVGSLVFGDGEEADADLEFVVNAHQDIAVLVARVRELEDRLDERTADVAEHALENAQLRAENERLRTAWHSAKARASTAREHLDITEHGRDRAIEAVEQLQAELATERAVAESNQRAARLLAADVHRLTAELAEAHAATETNREVGRVLLTELATHRKPAT